VAYLYSLTTRRSPKTLHPPHGALGYLGRISERVRVSASRERAVALLLGASLTRWWALIEERQQVNVARCNAVLVPRSVA